MPGPFSWRRNRFFGGEGEEEEGGEIEIEDSGAERCFSFGGLPLFLGIFVSRPSDAFPADGLSRARPEEQTDVVTEVPRFALDDNDGDDDDVVPEATDPENFPLDRSPSSLEFRHGSVTLV